MIDGIVLNINGTEYTVPPLNFKSIKALRPHLESLTGIKEEEMVTDEQVETFITVVHAALVRNYPDMTCGQVEEMLDLGNIKRIVDAIMGNSGFVGGAPAGGGPTGMESTAT